MGRRKVEKVSIVCKTCSTVFYDRPKRIRVYCSHACQTPPSQIKQDVGYSALHRWLRENYGKASRCESSYCSGKSKTYQWAKITGRPYTRNREDYLELCVSCHRKYDMTEDTKAKIIRNLRSYQYVS